MHSDFVEMKPRKAGAMARSIIGLCIISVGLTLGQDKCNDNAVSENCCPGSGSGQGNCNSNSTPPSCYEKLGSRDLPDSQFCALFKAAKDSDFFLFNIRFPITVPPDSMFDSTRMAQLRRISDEMFTKYDIRNYDSTRILWPLRDREVDYNYESVLFSKATALALKEEPYIAMISHRLKPAQVSIIRGTSRVRDFGTGQIYIDALGKSKSTQIGRSPTFRCCIGPKETQPFDRN